MVLWSYGHWNRPNWRWKSRHLESQARPAHLETGPDEKRAWLTHTGVDSIRRGSRLAWAPAIWARLQLSVFVWPRSLLRADIRLLVVKITFVVAEITFTVTEITSSVSKITFVVAEITFKVVMSTSSVAKIIFRVAEITFKVIVTTSSVAKITFVVV